MKALFAAAAAAAFAAPAAMAGPYAETKHEFKGTDEDYKKAVHQVRVGYETKYGSLSPYIEGGVGRTFNDGGTDSDFTVLEVGSKIKFSDSFGGYGKFENVFKEGNTRDWKVELGTKYKF